MPKSKSAYPRFSPTRIDNHEILGKVKVFNIGKYPTPDDDGCQTSFFTNNAKVNNSRQFGFKMFNTSVEAFAAYQRQTLAAERGLAPPTGKMIRWIVKSYNGRTVNRWGYETAIADCSPNARRKATILSCPQVMRWYTDYVRTNRCKMFSASSMEAFLDHAESEGYENANGRLFSQFSCANATSVHGSLRKQLMDIDLTGTQYDNLAEIYDDGESWQDNARLRLGQTVTVGDYMVMSNDLHRGNIALWKGNPVVIDFGYHIAIPEYRDYDCMETIDNWYGKDAA
jgi:hypothetical protein